jgi:hypothetical protein
MCPLFVLEDNFRFSAELTIFSGAKNCVFANQYNPALCTRKLLPRKKAGPGSMIAINPEA